MESHRPPSILVILGTLALICIPLSFFFFGWHALDVSCARTARGIDCELTESFAADLYRRKVAAERVTGISYNSRRRNNSGSNAILASNLVFHTPQDEVAITLLPSNTADAEKRLLVRKFRRWMWSVKSPRFEHHADLVDLFGWLGVIGLAFWAWLLPTWLYHFLKHHRTLRP